MLNNLKAIIFDVHKTLVDDSGFPREKIWKLLQQAGADFTLDEYYCFYDDLTPQLFNWTNIHNFIKIRDIHRKRLSLFYKKFHIKRDIENDLNYLWHSMGSSEIYPEVPAVLIKLAGKYKIGLLSNADNDDPLIQILFDKGYTFDSVVTSESLQAYKPQSVMFEKILNELHCSKDDVLLIGDSLISDVLGAKKFGIKVVWLNRSGKLFNNDFPRPDYEISNLNELINIIK